MSLFVLALLAATAGWFFVDYEIDQLPHMTIRPGLLQTVKAGAPYDVLLVGSSAPTRADLVLVARVEPAAHSVELLAVPTALSVQIPGRTPGLTGVHALGDSLAGGPSLLVQTVEASLKLPVEHVIEVSTAGFAELVDRIGGVYLDFPMPMIDQATGLRIGSGGCRQVDGAEAVQLTGTSTPYYFTDGAWHQQAAAAAGTSEAIGLALVVSLLERASPSLGNPIGILDLVRASSGEVRVDATWSAGALRGAATQLASVPSTAVSVETLPTRPLPNAGPRVVLAEPGATTMLSAFMTIGAGGAPRATAGTSQLPAPWLPSACAP